MFQSKPVFWSSMLTVYHSNRLDILKKLIGSIMERKHLDHPLESEVILLQSTGMAKWLQISLSHQFGIAANIKFLLPGNFIWEVLTRSLLGFSQDSTFNKKSMSWKLMFLLPRVLKYKELIILKQYLNDDINKRKLFQLASRIADIYEKYLMYRPSWLLAWESNLLIEGLSETQNWQAFLWKALVKLTKQNGQSHWHFANLYDHFMTNLESVTKSLSWLPSRIFICGITTLPPVYLNILKILAQSIDIHIMVVNPCRYHWWGIQNINYHFVKPIKCHRNFLFQESIAPLFNNQENAAQLFSAKAIQTLTHPLLDSWGKMGRDYIYMLSNISGENNTNTFMDITPDSLLHNIQLDILRLKNQAVIGLTKIEFVRSDMKRKLDPGDRSLTVHICHSLQRETEVLHDQLLAILQDNPTLTTRDIVVMVPDIHSYSPFIHAVFGGATEDRYIPYTISDYQSSHNPVLQAFMSLLFLPDGRFTSEDILALLEIPMLAARFNIDKENLQCLRQWIHESGIRWGLDDEHIQEFQLPVTGQHTWKFGLTRMLLGYAMESSEGTWKEVLPYDESNGLIAELIGRLASLLMLLTHWYQQLKKSYTLEAWLPLCQKILSDFFLPESDTEGAMAFIKEQWRDVINEGISSHYRDTIPLYLLRDKLIQRFNQEHTSPHLLAGPVNICTPILMHSIPFKVVCFLGINDGVYPKVLGSVGFNLINEKTRILGDSSQRDQDQYLFLEALISAQQIFYISYIGHSIQDNSKRYPSILVQELMDYIGQSYYLPGDERRNCDKSAQHVKKHITFNHSRTPFDPINYKSHKPQSYVREWLSVAKKEKIVHTDFLQMLHPLHITTLTLEELQNFWSHPIRAFFKQRLQVNLDSEDTNIPNMEPFILEGLNCYRLNKQLLNALVEQRDTELLFHYYRAAGWLPYGSFGKIIWKIQYQEMQKIAKRVLYHRKTSQNIEINLHCDGIQLTGWLHHAQENGLLYWSPAVLNISQGLQLWLKHLAYSASGNKGGSRFIVHKDGEWYFPPMPTEVAYKYLSLFIKGYLEGMNKPLLLLPASAWAWIKTCYDTNNDTLLTDKISLQKARSNFFQVYKGNSIIDGEGKDIWYQRLCRTFEQKHFNIIIEAARCYLLPLIKFRQS